MSSSLIRLGGMAAVVAGILLVLAELMYLVVDEQNVESLSSVPSVLQEILFLSAAVLLVGGLLSLCAGRLERLGVLGSAGFLISLVGTVLAAGVFWQGAFVLPPLAEQAPELVEAGPPPLLNLATVLSLILFSLGWLLLGVAMLGARVYPRVPTVLLIVGAVLAFVPLPFTYIIFGVAVSWMGLSLLSEKDAPAEQPARVR